MKNLPPFYLWQKVVCVDDSNQNLYALKIKGNAVKKGKKYIVKSVYFFKDEGKWGVSFFGVFSGVYQNGTEGHFRAERFRAIEEKPMFMTFEKIKEKEKEEVLILN